MIFKTIFFRYMLRDSPVPIPIQRASLNLSKPASDEFMENDPSPFFYLEPNEKERDGFFNQFRRSFLHGSKCHDSMLLERRLALLQAARNGHQPQNFKNLLDAEIKKLKTGKKQIDLRRSIAQFTLDEEGVTANNFFPNFHPTKYVYPVSPHHQGVFTTYDDQTAIQTNQKDSFITKVLLQANKFKTGINQNFARIKSLNSDLNLHFKNKNRQSKKNERNADSKRIEALKNRDMTAYRELVKGLKNDRIQTLLNQTDKYMRELSDKIKVSSSDAQENDYELNISLALDVKQPTILQGELKEYQLKGLQWMVSLYRSDLNGILADEMGLGKTIQAIALLAYLFEAQRDPGPHLVCAPLSTLPNWKTEFDKWLPLFNVIIYKGNPQERKELEQRYFFRGAKVNVVLTSYEFVVKDKAVLSKLAYSYLIIDEAHRLKNSNGKLSKALSAKYYCRHRLLLTGTPLQNTTRELWSLLNFVLPKIFNDHQKFEEWFSAPFQSSVDKVQLSDEEQWVIVNQLHRVLRPFLFRRTKSEVAGEIPDKIEKRLLCKMSAWQKVVYDMLDEKNVIISPDGKVQRLENTTMQYRKICNHPYLFLDTYYLNSELIRSCGKFEVLDRILPKLKEFGHRILIFSQMANLLDLLEDFMKMKDYKYFKFYGGTKAEIRQQYIDEFNSPDSDVFCFLLSTRAGGLGLNLQAADTVIMYDQDWNPSVDSQAAARAYRVGQSKEVLILHLMTADSIEEYILNKAEQKQDVENKIISAGIFDDKSTMAERKAFMQKLIEKKKKGEEDSVPDDEQINKMIARSDAEFERFQEMDIERTQNYQEQWTQSGHKGVYPPLVTKDELPAYLKVNVDELLKPEELPTIRKSRSRSLISQDIINEDELEKILGSDAEETPSIKAAFDSVEKTCGELFDTLPTRSELPEYYKIIKNPITLSKIRDKVKGNHYRKIEDLESDVNLMCQNAMRFNSPETIFYKIADDIQSRKAEIFGKRRR